MDETLAPRLNRISQIEKKCRDALGYQSVISKLSLTIQAFERACALLDFIDDTQQALHSILEPQARRALDTYFLAYGLLQTLYARQCALRDVLKTLQLEIPASLKKSALVTARDCVIGHPISNDGAAHVIVRHTLNADGFEYWSYRGIQTIRGNKVSYRAIMDAHIDAMEAGLESMFHHIAEFENVRRRQMRNQPLSHALHGIRYVADQIVAALSEPKYGETFETNSTILLSALQAFREGLRERVGEERTMHDVDHVIEGIHMLKSLFPPKDTTASLQYRIVADGIDSNMKHLLAIARDIDEQESSDLVLPP